MANLYASVDALKDRCNISRTDLDAQLIAILSNVSRQIDMWCGRIFYVETATRTFTYREDCAYPPTLPIDDLTSVTSIKFDYSGRRLYDTTLATTDYDLCPESGPFQSPPGPFTEIALNPIGRYPFPTTQRGIQIVSSGWGYSEALVRSLATVATGGINTSATTLPVSNAALFEVGQTILIGSEQLYITALTITPSPDTLTVVRGVNGTTAAAHIETAVIDYYTYPVVAESCLQQAQRRFERTIGRPSRSDVDPNLRAYASLDRDIQDALVLFKIWAVA